MDQNKHRQQTTMMKADQLILFLWDHNKLDEQNQKGLERVSVSAFLMWCKEWLEENDEYRSWL